MSANTAQISNPSVQVKPSHKLKKYISNVKVSGQLPYGISKIVFKNKVLKKSEKQLEIDYLITEDDRHFIKSIKSNIKADTSTKVPSIVTSTNTSDNLLSLQDLRWLYEYINNQNKNNEEKVYIHELLEGSEIVLPKNEVIPRNEELEKRCQKLKAEQQNRDYLLMTKNVDSVKKKLPEDTFAYQVKQMNKHLVAIFQFILSVAAGFAFGFLGVELIIGSLDFGFRLLLGIICALIIALAELYFLAKKLNEEIHYEYNIDQKKSKVD